MIHSALRFLSLTGAFLSIPVMAMLCSQVARVAGDGYQAFIGGQPLPQLTQVWILEVTQSVFFIPAVFMFAGLLWGCTLFLLKRDDSWTLTGTLLLSSIGFTFSLLLVGTTCISAVLPFVGLNIGMETQ